MHTGEDNDILFSGKKNICIYIYEFKKLHKQDPRSPSCLTWDEWHSTGRNLLEKFNYRGSGLKDTRLTEARIPH